MSVESECRELYRTLQTSTDLYRGRVLLNPDTHLGSFGPGVDPPRSKAANPPPRLGLLGQKPRKSSPGGGVPHRTLGPKMVQISILGALGALGLFWWRLGDVLVAFWALLGASWGDLGAVLGASWGDLGAQDRTTCVLRFCKSVQDPKNAKFAQGPGENAVPDLGLCTGCPAGVDDPPAQVEPFGGLGIAKLWRLRWFVTALATPDGVRPDFALVWGVVGARSGLLLLFGACLSWSTPDSGKLLHRACSMELGGSLEL